MAGRNRQSLDEQMVRVPGFEPGAYGLGGRRSIQLSYTRMFVFNNLQEYKKAVTQGCHD